MRKQLPGWPILWLTIFWSAAAFPQNSNGPVAPPVPPRRSPAWLLIEEAKSADTQEGAQRYAKHLATMFVSARAGEAYVNEFSHRLALADLAARQGKRNWIPEATIAQAFDDMMRLVTPPSSKPLHTDASVVHQMRLILYAVSHDLSSVDSHRAECLPSEAIDVMMQLLSHDGTLCGPYPPMKPAAPKGTAQKCTESPEADALVFAYMASHPRPRRQAVYERVTQLFSF